MRWIPIRNVDQGNGNVIRLPCPSIDLIRLASVSRDDKAVGSVLRRSPTLLLHALAIYRQDFGRPPASARELVGGCRTNLIGSLDGVEGRAGKATDPPLPGSKKLETFFEDFFSARNNRELRYSLRRFLRRFANVEKPAGKCLVNALVGKSIRADHFRSKGIRRKKTLAQVVSSWSLMIPSDVNVARLLKTIAKKIKSRADFDDELLRQKLAAMKQLAYGASHEINNPLANIATRAQTMLANETEPEKRHKLSVIYEQAMRAHEMISDMMLFAHPPAIQRKRVSIRLLMAKIINEMDALLASTPGTFLEVTVGAGVDQAFLDPTQIAVLIKNLIQNSVEAIRSPDQRNGRIEVRIDRTAAGEIRFSVWDNGMGISDKIARHLFDPFFSGREAGRGLGFGLSKVWSIAQLHGGDVRFDRKLKTGTRFFVQLPVEKIDVSSDRLPELSISKKRLTREDEAA